MHKYINVYLYVYIRFVDCGTLFEVLLFTGRELHRHDIYICVNTPNIHIYIYIYMYNMFTCIYKCLYIRSYIRCVDCNALFEALLFTCRELHKPNICMYMYMHKIYIYIYIYIYICIYMFTCIYKCLYISFTHKMC